MEPDRSTSRPAFERCFRAHYADVLAFAMRRVAGRQAAEDVAAETFVVAWRRRELIPEVALPWLYGIALRLIANQRRSARRQGDLEQRLEGQAALAGPAGDLVDALHRRTTFADAFRRLNGRERQVLSLIAWDGLAPREAAAALGCPHPAFRVRFHRARRKLEKHLEDSGHLPKDQGRTKPQEPAEEIR
jgi:RNA polymerase sigma-70 factor, ECF subfamily